MKNFAKKFILYSLLVTFTMTVVQSHFNFSIENEDDLTEEIIKLSESESFGEILSFEYLSDLMCDAYSSKSLIYLSNDFLQNASTNLYPEPIRKQLFSPPELINS